MVERKELILDSIKRLIDLGVGDKDILAHLQDVGLSQKEAIELLAEARGGKKEEAVGRARRAAARELAKPEAAKPAKSVLEELAVKAPKAIEAKPSAASAELTALWEKGIIVAVDEKLKEMKRIKVNLEKILDAKIDKAMAKERKKIEVLFDSRKTLLVAKINAALESKAEEVTGVITQRLEEIKSLEMTARKDMIKIEAKETIIRDLYKRTNTTLAEIKKVKLELQKNVGIALTESKEASAKMDERISRTLELESKIAEGLVSEARERMERQIEAKASEIESRLKARIDEVKAIRPELPPETVAAIEKKASAIALIQAKTLIKAAEAKAEERDAALEGMVSEETKKLDAKLDTALKSSQALEGAVKKKLARVDKRLKELTAFEKSVSEELSALLEAMEKKYKA